MTAVLAPTLTPEDAYALLHPEPPPEALAVHLRLFGLSVEALHALAAQYEPPVAELLGRASDLLLLEEVHALTAFLHEPGDPPAYVFVGPAGREQVTAKQLLEFRYARPALLTATGRLVPPRSRHQWDCVVTLLLRAQTLVTLAPEETRAGRAADWLRSYLGQRPPGADVDEAVMSDYPWTDSTGAVCVFGTAVRKTVLFDRQQRVDDREFGQAMRAAGCTPFTAKVGTGASRTTRSAWRLPAGLATD